MNFMVENGCFRYGKGPEILRDISFSIGERQILSVLGPNGVGKTTLIQCMLGLLPWSSGQSRLDGVPCTGRQLWKKIGYVPQKKQSGFAYTVEEMVLLGRSAHLGLFSQPGEADKAVAQHAMELTGTTSFAGKLCSRISGGELQMVLIARALAAEPKLLILDEPESNLDFKNQRIVLDLIRELCQKEGISSILNTHYPEHAVELSHRLLLLRRGKASLFGRPEEIVTEENLEATFGLKVYIRPVLLEQAPYTCIIPGKAQ